MMTLHNTLTKTKEHFIPRQDKKIQMFVCGPTVYDHIHIGNARTFVFFDVVAKYFRSQGYEVDYIQNITDIDDKIITRAKENNREPLEYAKEYYQKFREDMDALGVSSPRYIPATEHIQQVIKQVKTLIDKGFAYEIEGEGWYFDLSKFPDYGKLSGRKAQMADDAVSRIDESDKKRNKGDFVLWKFSKEGEPSWETELGKGRPGWHIEDTAITEHYFGPQYDIHGGGQDLIFPHHEAEITQQESVSGKKPFVKYWLHVAFLINKEQKMSKSLGNFETVNELLKKYPKEVLRFYLLSGHYRQPLTYETIIFNQISATILGISDFMGKLSYANGEDNEVIDTIFNQTKNGFIEEMNNDFNIPGALGSLFEMIKLINPLFTENKISRQQSEKILIFLKELDLILGIIPFPKTNKDDQDQAMKIDKFRSQKDYKKSDEIRENLRLTGAIVSSTASGTIVIRPTSLAKTSEDEIQ